MFLKRWGYELPARKSPCTPQKIKLPAIKDTEPLKQFYPLTMYLIFFSKSATVSNIIIIAYNIWLGNSFLYIDHSELVSFWLNLHHWFKTGLCQSYLKVKNTQYGVWIVQLVVSFMKNMFLVILFWCQLLQVRNIHPLTKKQYSPLMSSLFLDLPASPSSQ